MTPTNSLELKRLGLPPVEQLGIIVKDITNAVDHYSALLNISCWYRAKIAKKNIHYLGNPIDLDLDIVVGYSGRLQFELIQVIRGDENVYTDFIRDPGHGIHHIGFVVTQLSEKINILKKEGFKLLQHGTFETKGKAVTRFAYFDTMDQFGYITELIQTTFLGVNVGMSRWMMKIGTSLGDVDLIKKK